MCDLECGNGILTDDCRCECYPGYSGDTCDENIDDCAPNPCQNGGTCIDGINYYNCTCVVGFNGTDCETNIDDCRPNPCKNGGTCDDLVNDYNCTCTEDFAGKNCTDYIGPCPYNYMPGEFLKH